MSPPKRTTSLAALGCTWPLRSAVTVLYNIPCSRLKFFFFLLRTNPDSDGQCHDYFLHPGLCFVRAQFLHHIVSLSPVIYKNRGQSLSQYLKGTTTAHCTQSKGRTVDIHFILKNFSAHLTHTLQRINPSVQYVLASQSTTGRYP